MRRSVLFFFALLSTSATQVMAQDVPRLEVFVGYSHFSSTILDQKVNGNGGVGSFAFNANRWVGGVAEFGIYHESLNNGSAIKTSATGETFLFGPKVSVRGNERFTPFAQALFGGMRLGSVSFGAEGVSDTAFVMDFGGGLDVNLNHPFAVRVVQVDWLRTHFHGNSTTSNWQNTPRVSVGIVVRMND